MNTLVRGLSCALILILRMGETSQLCGQERSLHQYYLDVSQRGYHARWGSSGEAQEHVRSLCVRQTYKTCSVYLIVGDIFEFIGNRSSTPLSDVSAPYNVDAVLLSTNVDAKWREGDVPIDNPTVQKTLRQFLNTPQHQSAYAAVDQLFSSTRQLQVCQESIVTRSIPEFSPRQFCFIATDRKEGGTYMDLDFLDSLNEESLALGVCAALSSVNRSGAHSIVMPFLASSRPDLRGQLKPGHKAYLNPASYEVKAQIIKRNAISLSGMLWGVQHFIDTVNPDDLKTSQIGIVLYHDDLKYFNDVENAVKEYFGFEGLKHALVGKTPKAEVFERLLSGPRDKKLSERCD